MALETATYIDGLVATNPAASDAINTADDHLRLIKSTVKATFPNINAAVTKTAAEINDALEKSGGTMTGPLTLAGDPTENLQAATKAYVDSALGGVDAGVVSFSAGSTGLTPSSATGGVVTLGGTLAVTNGGTGSTTAAGARSNLAVPSTTGSGASGTWGISISGNAATATKLSTASGSAPSYSARAWVNFNGSGSSPSIRDDDNVSTVAYGGSAGFFTVNFSTSMPSSSYAALVTCGIATGQIAISSRSDVQNTGSFTTSTVDQSGTGAWAEDVMAAVFI